ncbi:hypothetical protein R3P38DRAFT_3287532 [Favolaschia claudopus]|uniref:Uncharacterized protein n=1 Tax=Favolaschia claudopus TaxID=2862362 RepID=A0AAW0A063_9AGAR
MPIDESDPYYRVQRSAWSVMDTKAFTAPRLMPIKSSAIWALATTEEGRDLLELLGTSTLDYLVIDVLKNFPVLQKNPINHRIVEEVLKCEVVCSRMLMQSGAYQDDGSCPFFGLMSGAPKTVLTIWIGGYTLYRPGKVAGLQLQTWFLSMYRKIAAAAVAALNPNRRLARNPKLICRLSDLDSDAPGANTKTSKSRKPGKANVTVLAEISNLDTVVDSQRGSSSAGGKVPAQKENKARSEPYPPPIFALADSGPVYAPYPSLFSP